MLPRLVQSVAVVSFLSLVKVEVEVKETSSVFVVGINEQILFLCYSTLAHSHHFSHDGFHRNHIPIFLPPSRLTQKFCLTKYIISK